VPPFPAAPSASAHAPIQHPRPPVPRVAGSTSSMVPASRRGLVINRGLMLGVAVKDQCRTFVGWNCWITTAGLMTAAIGAKIALAASELFFNRPGFFFFWTPRGGARINIINYRRRATRSLLRKGLQYTVIGERSREVVSSYTADYSRFAAPCGPLLGRYVLAASTRGWACPFRFCPWRVPSACGLCLRGGLVFPLRLGLIQGPPGPHVPGAPAGPRGRGWLTGHVPLPTGCAPGPRRCGCSGSDVGHA